MADRKITDLTALAAGSQATGDLLTIVDVSESAAADKNKKITVDSLFKGIPGDVGIGTSSPAHKLDVNGQIQAKSQFYLTDSSSNDILRITEIAARDVRLDAYNGTDFNGTIRFGAQTLVAETGTGGSVSERLRIDSSGRVGIGTSSPSVELSLAGSDPQLCLWEGTDGASSSKVQLGTGTVQGFINVHKGDGTRTIQLSSDGDTYFTGGNVGIGTTSPADTLHVRGPVSGTILNLDRAGSYSWKLGQSSGSDLTFTGDTSERIRLLAAGGLTFNGDTAAANALDDYEQGSYTPISVGASVSITVNEALYTKIGNRVWVDVDIVFASSASGNNSGISLPFAMSANDHYGSGLAGWTDFGDGCKIHVGGARAYLMKMDNTTAGNQHVSFANISGKRFIMGFSYETA